jgi:aldose 1-epimerase
MLERSADLVRLVGSIRTAGETMNDDTSPDPHTPQPFGLTQHGTPVLAYRLANENGMAVTILNYGGTIARLLVPDRHGKAGDVVLGFDAINEYENHAAYFGSLIGRVGNRIARGKFTLDDHTYTLALNNGPNHLHGGIQGYDKRVWEVEHFATADGPTLRLTLTDSAGTEGYPGTVHVTVVYSLTAENGLKIQYLATCDAPTPINLTNHTYFNLKDGGASDIGGHELALHASRYLPVDSLLIPTGEVAPVKGTEFDFTTAKTLGQLLAVTDYDHNFVIDQTVPGEMTLAGEVYEPHSGRVMEIWTSQPGVQFYTGNFLNGIVGKEGKAHHKHHAFCLETQHFPDAVNQPTFPSVILRPGQTYRQVTEYRFSAR